VGSWQLAVKPEEIWHLRCATRPVLAYVAHGENMRSTICHRLLHCLHGLYTLCLPLVHEVWFFSVVTRSELACRAALAAVAGTAVKQ
jgi:hypothetical protein